jgi:ABC-type sugar transport system substrate-binding protein
MLRDHTSDRRGLVVGSARAAAITVVAGVMGLPASALAQGGAFGPKRKFIWVPQALGDWDMAFQVGARDFCEMVGWEYQRIGNPVYSVQNHAEQVNNAIAAKADAIATSLESVGLVQPFERGLDQGIAMIITDQASRRKRTRLACTSSTRTSSTPASSTARRRRPSPTS